MVFLHVGAASEEVAAEEEESGQTEYEQRRVGDGRERHQRIDADAIDEGVEAEATPNQLETHILVHEIVGVLIVFWGE